VPTPRTRPARAPATITAPRARTTPTRTTATRATGMRAAPTRTGTGVGSPSSAIGGAPAWVSGLLAGSQAALLSALVVVMPALAAYVATSADPANAEVGWPQSVAVGGVLWLLGHGAIAGTGGALVTLVPLGITGLAVFSAFASARRSAQPTRGAWLAGIGGYAGVVVVVVALVGDAGPLGAGAWGVIRTILGTLAIAAVGLGLGLLRSGSLREITRPLWSRVHPLLRASGRAGVMVVATLVATSAVVTSAWLVSGRAAAGDVIDGLGLDTFSGGILAFAQLALAPNLVLWVTAWVAGPGFSVGEGTLYSPTEVVSGPLPALPMLGALPTEGGNGPAAWAPLLVIGTGALAGWWLHRNLRVQSGWETFAAALGTGVVAGLAAGALTLLAGGSAGPGRLAVVGGPALSVAMTVAGLALVGALLTAVPTDDVVRARCARVCRTIWSSLRGTTPPAEATPTGTEPGG